MISQENCNFLFPWKDGFNPHHRSWQQQESRSRAQLLPSTLEASKKYSQRLAAMCLPIRLHHAYSTTQQELLYFFMDLMKEDVVLRRQAAPQLVSFLEDLNDEDLMWRNSAESGFAFHFLRKLLEVIMLDDDNRSDIIAFVVHKLSFLNLRQANAASQAASLQQQVEAILMPSEENAFDTLGLEGGEEGGIPLTSTTRNAESAPFQFTSKERGRFLLTQELFHTIASTAKTQLVDWSAHALTIVELAQETIGFVLPILIQEHNTQKHGANTSTAGSVVQCITGLVLQALAACYHMLRTLWNNSTKERNIKLEAFDAAFDLAHLVLGSSIHHVSKEVEKLSLLLEIQVTLYSMNQFHLDMCFQSIVRYLNSFPRDTLHQGLVSLCLSQEAESMEQRGGLMKLPSTASHTSSELEDILEVLQATLDILTNIYETNLSEFESRSRPVTTAVSKLLVEIVNMGNVDIFFNQPLETESVRSHVLMLTPQQQQLLTRTILQTQDVLKRCVAIMRLETKVFTSSLQLEFIRTTSYSTVMSLMDMLNMYAIAQQQFLPVVVQALEVIWIFAESSQDAVNHLHEWISKELLKTLPALLAVQKQSKHAIYSIKVVKLFTDRFLKVIRSHPSSIFQEQLLSMVAKLFYHQLDELLGQDMRRLLTLLHRPQSQDQWFHWRNNLHHMKEQVVSISICLAEVASRSAFVSMSVLDGWIKSSTDLIVRSVIYFFHNEYEHVKHELCDVAMEIIKALLQNMMLLKKWKMSKSSTNSSSNSHDYILNENLLTMRLWLALFLWKSKMRLAVDAEVEADLHESLQELAKHTAPMSFSRILCNASTSKKKQSDIVDELFENDNDLICLLRNCMSSTDISWIRQEYDHKRKFLKRRSLSLPQHYYFLTMYFLEYYRMHTSMDLTLLSMYIQDSVLWPSPVKRKITKNIISELTEQWLRMIVDHYIRMHYSQADAGFEQQLQQQIEFLAARALDVRKEIRTYVVPIFLRYAQLTQSSTIPYFAEVEKGSDPMIIFLLEMVSQLDHMHRKVLGQHDHYYSTSAGGAEMIMNKFKSIHLPNDPEEVLIVAQDVFHLCYAYIAGNHPKRHDSLLQMIKKGGLSGHALSLAEELLSNSLPTYHMLQNGGGSDGLLTRIMGVKDEVVMQHARRVMALKLHTELTYRLKHSKVVVRSNPLMQSLAADEDEHDNATLSNLHHSTAVVHEGDAALALILLDKYDNKKLKALLRKQVDYHKREVLMNYMEYVEELLKLLVQHPHNGSTVLEDILFALNNISSRVVFPLLTGKSPLQLSSSDLLLVFQHVVAFWESLLLTFPGYQATILGVCFNDIANIMSITLTNSRFTPALKLLMHFLDKQLHLHPQDGPSSANTVPSSKASTSTSRGGSQVYIPIRIVVERMLFPLSRAMNISSIGSNGNSLDENHLAINVQLELCQLALILLHHSSANSSIPANKSSSKSKYNHDYIYEFTLSNHRILREKTFFVVMSLLMKIFIKQEDDVSRRICHASAFTSASSDKQTADALAMHNPIEELHSWVKLLFMLFEDSKRWTLDYHSSSCLTKEKLQEVLQQQDQLRHHQHRRSLSSVTSSTYSISSEKNAKDGHGQQAKDSVKVLFGEDAILYQSMMHLCHFNHLSWSSNHKASVVGEPEDNVTSALLSNEHFLHALQEQPRLGLGYKKKSRIDITAKNTHSMLQDSGVITLLFMLIRKRLDFIEARFLSTTTTALTSAHIGTLLSSHHVTNSHTEMEIKKSIEALNRLNELFNFKNMNELHMYKLAIKTAWVFSPSLAIAFRELYQDISVEDGKRKGIHHLLSFITTNTSYQSMSISLFANEEQTTSINWKCLPYLIEAIHSDKTSDEEKAVCMRSIDFLTSFITNAVPVHFMIQLLSSRCFHYFHESRRLSALDNASKEYALPAVMRFIVKCLYIASIDELLFYLPQFIQLLRQDEYGYIHELLCYVASTSPRICHQMVWYLQAESNTMNTAASSSRAVHGFCGDLNGEDNLPKKCKDLLHDIYSTLPARDLAYLQHEINFFNFVTSISGYLKLNVKNKELHSSTIKTMLLPVPIPPGVYMPTAPLRKVVGIEYDSAAPMQSAAKCPFLLKFKTIAWDGPDNFLMKQSSRTAKPAAGNGKLIGDGKLQTAEELYGGFLHAKSARNLIIHESKNIMALPSKIAKNPEEFLSEPSSREPSVKVGEMKVRLRSRRIYRNPRQKNANQKPEDGNVGGEEQFPLSDSETGSQSASETPKKGKKNMTNTGGIGKRTGTFTSPKLSKYGRNPSTSMMADVPGPQTPNKGFLNNVNVSSALPPSPMKPDSIVVKKKEEDVQFDACIFKVFDDCRQDVLTLQVMRMLRNWFQVKQIPVFLAPYNILSNRTTDNALGGILEVVPNVQSRDQLGKSGVGKTLEQYFLTKFGEKGSESYVAAQYAFASSLASYSVVCYLLQIKDRHNGNIVIDNLGHIIHIDFGFILGISPGHNMRFESAPFKLSQEMVNILDGIESAVYRRYVNLTVQSYLAAREIMLPILSVVAGYAESDLPCFRFRHSILSELRKRFRSDLSDMEAGKWMESLIERARTEWTTSVYDGVQKLQNNIYSPEWK